MATGSPVSNTPREFTAARTSADVVEVPPRTCLAISGKQGPETEEFAASVGALYGIAYGLKFARKKATGDDFKVGALVGVWWALVVANLIGSIASFAWGNLYIHGLMSRKNPTSAPRP